MKILLDTCVVSEMIKPRPDETVMQWFAAANDADLFLSSLTIGEICAGFRKLPDSPRRQTLERWFSECIEAGFAGRILPFDAAAAKHWAAITADASANGRPRPVVDSMIAAIARSNNMTLATRNLSDFTHTGIPTINPFAK